ncbi:integrase core domain-containing protein [Zoogloea sp.]|uniref:integrase core domain-containing protein n=1 Tax=Zoogloea sp. TaxID=49181 RepID=UPI0035B43816
MATCSLHGLKQEFITSYNPHQNGLVERMIPTLKEQCIHCHRVEALQHASRIIGDWIEYYLQRCHQAMDMQMPAEAFVLAA